MEFLSICMGFIQWIRLNTETLEVITGRNMLETNSLSTTSLLHTNQCNTGIDWQSTFSSFLCD